MASTTSRRKKKANRRRLKLRIKGRYEERHGRERRPRVEREREAPTTLADRLRLIRGLTRGILRIAAHLLRQPSWWRDRRRLYGLERAINTRGEALLQLRTDAPDVWASLMIELDLELPVSP